MKDTLNQDTINLLGNLFLFLENEKVKNFKGAAFMNIIKKRIYKELKDKYNNISIKTTFGHITKYQRINYKIEKSHHADAFVIAGGSVKEKMSYQFGKVKIC